MNVSTISPKPGSRVTAVLAAMPEEAAPLRAALRDVRVLHIGAANAVKPRGERGGASASHHVVSGQLGEQTVVLAVSGDGERNAREHTERLFAALHGAIERVLIVGVAGALSPVLHAGDVIVADEVRAEAGGPTLFGDRAWAEHALRSTGAPRGVAVSAARIADTVHEKRRLLALCAAAGKPCSVDLESFAYASVAARHGTPWLVMRAISDTAEESLPEVLNRSRDAGGAVLRSRVLRSLLTDPRPLPKLLRLQRRVARASLSLAGMTIAVLSHLLPPAADEPTVRSS